jgi:hypothetical protein
LSLIIGIPNNHSNPKAVQYPIGLATVIAKIRQAFHNHMKIAAVMNVNTVFNNSIMINTINPSAFDIKN